MQSIFKRAILLFALGFILGILLGFIIMGATENLNRDQQNINDLSLYLFTCGILGAINMAATVVYSIEHWGLLRTTLTHFCISMGTLCIIGFSVGWLNIHNTVTWIILIISIIVYFIIWFIMYWRYKQKIKKINDALGRWKKTQKDT
ncbi:MAG: DUF3021 domain-containing protein [Oscillospiraceae bacterium]|nr:DUF3021 domain-containing protein [Oscillospiraceae bacterium]